MPKVAVVALLSVWPALAWGAEGVDWAYPATPAPAQQDAVTPIHVPGSAKAMTQAQIDDGFNPPDWFPDEHPPLPEVVAHGSGKTVRGCALCHLPTGNGHPESASLAGQSPVYLERQMAAFRNGERKGVRTGVMVAIAKAISDEDTRAASAYFAGLKPTAWTRIVETETVPTSFVGAGGMRFPTTDGAREPIGHRIIEVPEDSQRAMSRDPHSGFIAYVAPGSIAKGEVLVTSGAAGKTLPCAICHGAALTGLGEIPGIAARSPIAIVRQLNDIQAGNRTGSLAILMKAVVAKLDADDMIAIAAYVGSREP
jgi:cytochrome c553